MLSVYTILLDMNGFNGDIEFTAAQEIARINTSAPYVVAAAHRGISLIIGVDLSIFHYNKVIAAYGEVLTIRQANSIRLCGEMKGIVAEKFLMFDPYLKTVRIPFELAIDSFPIFAERTWERTKSRWPEIGSSPADVQTAVFDVAYSRGVHNNHINCLTEFIRTEDWNGLAGCIRGMQQRSGSARARNRRKMAADLIS